MAGNLDKFNSKFNQHTDEINEALRSTDVTFILILAYTGTQPISQHTKQRLDELLEEYNDSTDIVTYRIFSQREIYSAISGDSESINLEVELVEWGEIREPFQAYYGQVTAEAIAQWYSEYDSRLFARNLRKFKGNTEVNQSMKSTLIGDSGKFWYFNNGITVLCESVKKTRIGGQNRGIGRFICEGVSVVNGAQTVGSIASTVTHGFQLAKEGRVLVRFISLENCPPDFAAEVTKATNTQNRIERRDFASLDPNQERLSQELKLDVGRIYAFKSGDTVPSPGDGCTIDEATVALACAYNKLELATEVKQAIGRLWKDIKKQPYTYIFNDDLSALRLWNSVKVMRLVDNTLERILSAKEISDVEQRVAIHGNRFVLHHVFQNFKLYEFDAPGFEFDSISGQVEKLTVAIFGHVVELIQRDQNFGQVYLNTFFKNHDSATVCRQ